MTDLHLDDRTLAGFSRSTGESRERIREHLARCADCRSRLAGEDPSRIFSMLGGMPLPRGVLDEVSRAVAADVAAAGLARGRVASPWRVVGALAASLLLATLVGLPLVGPPGDRRLSAIGSRPADAGPAPRAAVSLVKRADRADVFDLTVGETQVVMIFDEGMEL